MHKFVLVIIFSGTGVTMRIPGELDTKNFGYVQIAEVGERVAKALGAWFSHWEDA